MSSDCNPSSIPKLEVPEFKPSIPKYMVDNINDETLKFLIEQVSIIKQQNKWQSEHIAEVFDYTRKINGKVIELEKYRQAQEFDRSVKEQIESKKITKKKYILPLILFGGVFLYPLYISIFLQVGPVNVIDFITSLFS